LNDYVIDSRKLKQKQLDCAVFYVPANTVEVMGDGFYKSKDPTNSIKVLKEATNENKNNTKNIIHIEIRNSTR